jgi:NitT/TauT family transport system permease protein
MALQADLFMHIMVSLWRTLSGLFIAFIIAIPAGFLLGRYFTYAARVMDPLLRVFGQVNPFSVMPVFMLFFGIGEEAKLAVVAWVCIWPLLFHTINGARSVDPVQVKTARAMGVSEEELFRKVILPSSMLGIFNGLRIGVEMSFFMLIAAEMIGASAGLGWLVHNMAMNYQIARMYSAGLVIVLLGMALNYILKDLQERLFFWKESQDFFGKAVIKIPLKRDKMIGKGLLVFYAALFVFIIAAGSIETVKAGDLSNTIEHHHMKSKG